MRRSVRPVFFPAPLPEFRPLAERLLRDATQSGVLDFPALVHAPIEKWLVSHLCRTTITPNQITLGTGVLGLSVTVLYALGYLWVGALLALIVGVLDGVDGKLARLKVQTTRLGKGEHVLDYCIEMSWWAALAYYFHADGQVPSLIRYGLSSLSLICSCAGRKGSLGENLAAASMMSRDSIDSCAMLRAGAIFIPGCLPLASHSGCQRMALFGSVSGE